MYSAIDIFLPLFFLLFKDLTIYLNGDDDVKFYFLYIDKLLFLMFLLSSCITFFNRMLFTVEKLKLLKKFLLVVFLILDFKDLFFILLM